MSGLMIGPRGRAHILTPERLVVAAVVLLVAVAAILPMLSTDTASAAEVGGRVSLTNVGVSPASSGAPGSPPVTVAPGGQFKGWFYFNNPNPGQEGVALNVTIKDPQGKEYGSSGGLIGASCQVPALVAGHLCSLVFGVPQGAPSGTYSVHYNASPVNPSVNPWSDHMDRGGWLIVQGPPTPTPVPPTPTPTHVPPTATPVPPTPGPGPQLCVSPNSLDFGDSGNSATFSIRNCGGQSLIWSVSSGQSWASVSPSRGTGDAAITVNVSRSGLGEGAYTGSIAISSNGGNATVSIAMVVSNRPVLCLSRNSIDFGTGNNSDTFSIHNCGGGTLAWFITNNQGWFNTNTTSGVGDATITVTVNRSGLGQGRYAGIVSVDAGTGPQSVAVAMQVSNGPGPLAGQVSNMAINPGSAAAGSAARISANVQNTGTSTAVFHLFTANNSVCGYRDWTATLNPGQTAPAGIQCDLPGTTATGNYYINVTFEMALPGQAYQNKSSVANLALGINNSGPIPPGATRQFFFQTNFWVNDYVPYPDTSVIGRIANFFTEFKRLGGVSTLGYPASRAYFSEGFMYQVFQRGILQYRTDYNPQQSVLANTMDWLYQAGKDDYLFSVGIPRHFTGDDGARGDFERAKQIRFGWMTDPAIRDTYFANPSPGQIPDSAWDPVTFYGLPTSQPQRFGAFTTQRFQRYVFQKWEVPVAGMPPAGTVVGVLAGDLAKQAGLVPSWANQPETP